MKDDLRGETARKFGSFFHFYGKHVISFWLVLLVVTNHPHSTPPSKPTATSTSLLHLSKQTNALLLLLISLSSHVSAGVPLETDYCGLHMQTRHFQNVWKHNTPPHTLLLFLFVSLPRFVADICCNKVNEVGKWQDSR